MRKRSIISLFLGLFAVLTAARLGVAAPVELKPSRVLVVADTRMPDAVVIRDANESSDVVGLLKLWGVPFDILRVDKAAMSLTNFVDGGNQPRYGTVIWTAQQNLYPWQPQLYSVLAQAVTNYHIGLIAVGRDIQEPVIQGLLGLQYNGWYPNVNAFSISSTPHFITRGMTGTNLPTGEAFPTRYGPLVSTNSSDVTVLASAGGLPQLTARTLDAATRTRAVWIGGDPTGLYASSPTFIRLLRRALVWTTGYGLYKDYGRSALLRMDDPGSAQSAYLTRWHYPQLSRTIYDVYVINPLVAHNAKLGVGYVSGYPVVSNRTVVHSSTINFLDPYGTLQNLVSTYSGLLDGTNNGVLEIHGHGFTHQVPDLDTPIPGSTNWWGGSITNEWPVTEWYREFYDTRRTQDVDTLTQTGRLTQAADWIQQDFGKRPLVFIPPGEAISGLRYQGSNGVSGAVSVSLSNATANSSYTTYCGGHGNPYITIGTLSTDSQGNGFGVFGFPVEISTSTGGYFTVNREIGTQFIAGPITNFPLSAAFNYALRDHRQFTADESNEFFLAVENFNGGSVTGSATITNYIPSSIASNYTYQLAAQTGYGLASDRSAHYLGQDYVVRMPACLTSDTSNFPSGLQTNFDRGVPAVFHFHDRDINDNLTFLSSSLDTIAAIWPNVYYLSMDEWSSYLHAQLNATAPTTNRVQLGFTYQTELCRYFDNTNSVWTFHLSDELLQDLQSLGPSMLVVDGAPTTNINPSTYFAETNQVTVPKGRTAHTILFRPKAADLSVFGTGTPNPVTVGQNLACALVVSNAGPATATAATLTFTLGPGATFVSASSGCAPVGSTVVCTLNDLTNGVSTNVTITVKPTVSGLLTNPVTVATTEADDNLANNSILLVNLVPNDADGNGIPDAWEYQYFGLTGVNPSADPDGDGLSNLQEYLTGTDPTNNASAFRITSITQQSNNVRIDWIMGAGKTNMVQFVTGGASGHFTNNFTDLFGVTNTVGTSTNYLDVGAATNNPARYYRIRLVP